MRLRITLGAIAAVLAIAGPAVAANEPGARAAWPKGTAVVTYTNGQALAHALTRRPATVVSRIPALKVVEVQPRGDVERYAAALASEPGIVRVEPASARRSFVEPALLPAPTVAFQWQYTAVRADLVPADVALAAGGVTIAVIDTGADLGAPDLAAKQPLSYSVRSRSADVSDPNGHGTFVAALAAGSGSNAEGIAGVAAEAKLLVVQAGGPTGSFTDVEEAAAIVYAVDHGARVVNLSLGGPTTSTTERRAIEYAASRDVLLIAAVGNGYAFGNPVEYPAALLQPVGSNGVGGVGLAVAASTRSGSRASFSSTGSHVSLAAPGEGVFSAVSTSSSSARYPRTPLPGSLGGLYGFGSGTSFAAPQVAGAAALVWAANPGLRAGEVASILEQTASGQGAWSPELGYGVVDVAAAVGRAQQQPAVDPAPAVSAPWTSLRPAAAQISLKASRLRGTRRVSLSATLAVADLPGAERGRTVVLEFFDGRRWKRLATALTDTNGRAVWRYAPAVGFHRVRARYLGTAEIAAATSRPITLPTG